MKPVGVAELKSKLAHHLDRVKAGEEVVITERGVPIARLVPLPSRFSTDARMIELVRRGAVRPPPGNGLDVEALYRMPRSSDPTGAVLRALLEEREEGR